MQYILKDNRSIFDNKRKVELSTNEILSELNHLHLANQALKDNNETLRHNLNHRTTALKGLITEACKLANLK